MVICNEASPSGVLLVNVSSWSFLSVSVGLERCCNSDLFFFHRRFHFVLKCQYWFAWEGVSKIFDDNPSSVINRIGEMTSSKIGKNLMPNIFCLWKTGSCVTKKYTGGIWLVSFVTSRSLYFFLSWFAGSSILIEELSSISGTDRFHVFLHRMRNFWGSVNGVCAVWKLGNSSFSNSRR